MKKPPCRRQGGDCIDITKSVIIQLELRAE